MAHFRKPQKVDKWLVACKRCKTERTTIGFSPHCVKCNAVGMEKFDWIRKVVK